MLTLILNKVVIIFSLETEQVEMLNQNLLMCKTKKANLY